MEAFYCNLPLIGSLSLGCFVGGIINYGLTRTGDLNEWTKAFTLILSTALGSAVLFYLDKIKLTPIEYSAYPIGFILALLWLQVPESISNRIPKKNSLGVKILGYAHVISITILTLTILYTFFFIKNPV